MKTKNLAVLALLAGGMLFAGSSAANAEDKPLPIVDCAEGYLAVSSADGYTVTCEPMVADDEVVDPINGCWITEDGTDVCARGFVGEEPQPIDSGCETTIADDGTESTFCTDAIAYSGVPVDDTMGNGSIDMNTTDLERVYKSASGAGSQDGTLAFLGMFFGLLGGAVLALMHKPATK